MLQVIKNTFKIYREKNAIIDRNKGSLLHYILYVEKGAIEYYTPREQLTLEAGSFYYLPVGMIYLKKYVNCVAHSCGFVDFPEAATTKFKPQPLPRKFLREFLDIPKTGSPDSNSLCKLYGLLGKLIPYLQSARDNADTSSILTSKIQHYVRYHLHCSIDEIAEYCGMSVPTLYRALKKDCGKTPNQIKQEMLIESACNLLVKTQHSVSEISSRLHFCNSNYFSRVFKEYTGKSPLQYRQEAQKFHID